jgi:hypothetical protein
MQLARPGVAFQKGFLALLLVVLLSPACAELELLTGASRGGPGPPPSGSLSVSFIDVGQGDGVLVQAGGESYLIDAGRPEEGPNVVDFLRSRGVDSLDGIVVTNPPNSQNTCATVPRLANRKWCRVGRVDEGLRRPVLLILLLAHTES